METRKTKMRDDFVLLQKKCLVDRIMAMYLLNFLLVLVISGMTIIYLMERNSRIQAQMLYDSTIDLNEVKLLDSLPIITDTVYILN